MKPAAVIDVGSNSVKLLIGRVGEGPTEVVRDAMKVTLLSEGVDATGRLSPAPMSRTLTAVKGFLDEARRLGADPVRGFGTRALREASNAQEFLARCAGFGLPVEVISGETEAEMVRAAAVGELSVAADALVVDIGGGSAELVWADGAVSTPLGRVRLAERCAMATDPIPALDELVATELGALTLPCDVPVVGSSGVCTTLAQRDLGLATYQPDRIHGHVLALTRLETLCADLARTNERVLLAGARVLYGVTAWVGADAVRINDRGTRFGLLRHVAG